MTARTFGEIAAQLAGRADERRQARDAGDDNRVRNYSYEIDDPRANRWNRLWNGTWREWNIWREGILAVAKDLRYKQRVERYRGEDRLQGNDLLVLDALLSFMNPSTAELYPKKDTIALRAGVSADTAHESLKRWWRLGFVRWVRRWRHAERKGEAGPQREQTSNGYYFEFKQLAQDVWHDLWAQVRKRLKGLQAAVEQRAKALAVPIPGPELVPAPARVRKERDSEYPGRSGHRG